MATAQDQHDAALRDEDGAGPAPAAPARRGLGRRLARGVGWASAGLVGVLVLTVTVTAVLEALDRRQVQPPGELVALEDGRMLHLDVAGPTEGGDGGGDGLTVVLEAGAGGTAATQAWLRSALADQVQVVSYDRAGYGFSDPTERPAEASAVVNDLHDGLAGAGVAGQLVLVGHSLGAGYARVFAAEHPDRVAALVLLDPVHEDQLAELGPGERASLEEAQQQLGAAPLLARLGVFRLSDPHAAIVASLPEDAGEQHRARSVTATGMGAYAAEMQALPELLDQIGQADPATGTPFAGVPVRVISASSAEDGADPASREVMTSLHRELAERAPDAQHLVVDDADHMSLLLDADHADTVADIVGELLDDIPS